MVASYAPVIILVVSLLVAAVALFLNGRRLPAEAAAAVTPRIYRRRIVYFVIVAVAALSLAFTLSVTPYPALFAQKRPDLVVKVTGQMWAWTLTPVTGSAADGGNTVLPAGKLVEFEVTSKDIIHDFGIYDSAGKLIAQEAAVPNHTSRLFYSFIEPGRYYVLCLNYCGLAHHSMDTEFEVR